MSTLVMKSNGGDYVEQAGVMAFSKSKAGDCAPYEKRLSVAMISRDWRVVPCHCTRIGL